MATESKWWAQSMFTGEELTILVLFGLGMGAMWYMGVDAKDLVVAIAAGLIGYLKGQTK